MTYPLLRSVGVSLVLLATALTVLPDEAWAAGDAGQRTWLWITAAPPVHARHLEMAVRPETPVPASGEAQFDCDFRSDFAYKSAHLTVTVMDDEGQPVNTGERAIDLMAGANTCRVALDTSALPLGSYQAEFRIAHELLLDEPSQDFILRKVNADNLLETLSTLKQRVAELDQSLRAMEETGSPSPYLRIKTNIAADVLQRAEEDLAREAWESLELQLRYTRERVDAISAGAVFGGVQGELSAAVSRPALNNLVIEQGAFTREGSPIFLFGGVLPDWDPEQVARLSRYQFNAATVTVAPDGAPGGDPGATGSFGRLRDVFDAAVNHNLAVAVQLAPDQLPADLLASHPELTQDMHVDIARSAAMEPWEPFVRQLGPVLNGQPMLLGISLARDPRFHFDGDTVKAGFLDFIRGHYPDRLTLNRSWRAHLASLEDITLWSTNPYDIYQQHRPYQFDWQTYHQSLGNAYFGWARGLVEAQVPNVPLMATLGNAVFSPGETRYGINREQLAGMMQISGCSTLSTSGHDIYALDYPEPSAYYTLLRSFEPDKPVFDLNLNLDLAAAMTMDEAYRYVHSALWEAVMSGLSAATIPLDSLVFQRPEALEAFATAALDVNRLASIVHAFQTAPADVGILFSYASKVFDDGDPHLLSASNAYEGVSFGGYNVRYITESQCGSGVLDDLKILVIPDTPALGDEAFQRIVSYVENGGTVARTGAPIPYNERGYSRGDLIRNTGNTVLVRGLNLPTEYLHAMDAATVLGALPQIPRPITRQGYPVEGVKSRYVEFEGNEYLYLVNLRKEPVYCTLATQSYRGRDLIRGRDVEFPATLQPLDPMLIQLAPAALELTVSAVQGENQ